MFTICQVVYSDTDCEELRRKHFAPFIIDGMRLMRLETRNLCFTNAIKQQREDKQAAALLAVTRQTIARTAQAVADRSLWSTVVQVVSPSQSSAMRSTNKFPKLIASTLLLLCRQKTQISYLWVSDHRRFLWLKVILKWKATTILLNPQIDSAFFNGNIN